MNFLASSLRKLAAAAVLTSLSLTVQARIDAPLPSNTYISFGGLDWAWALPLPAASGLDLTYQSQYGWRLPTVAELSNAPLATSFMFVGANVPLGGSDPVSGASVQATNPSLTGAAACATPYFSSSYSHCDWQDGNGQTFAPWAGTPGANSFADQLVVRQAAAVPEPESYALVSAGLAVIGALALRRKSA
jgi:hypothetical protein